MRLRLGNLGQFAAVAALLALLLVGCGRPKKSADAGSADSAPTDPQIVFFYQNGCWKCDQMKEVLAGLLGNASQLKVQYHDMDTAAGKALLLDFHRRYGLSLVRASAPEIFVGREVIAGSGLASELLLAEAVGACAAGDCPSPLRYAVDK